MGYRFERKIRLDLLILGSTCIKKRYVKPKLYITNNDSKKVRNIKLSGKL